MGDRQGQEPESRDASRRQQILKPLSWESRGSRHPSRLSPDPPTPCTYIGEVQAQLEFFIQPLASVIVGSCGGEDGVKQTSPQPTVTGPGEGQGGAPTKDQW